MPSDASGNYSLPVGYLAASGGTIQITQHNPPMEDIAQALTDRIMASGAKPMSGPLKLADGALATPALVFNSATGTGWYKTTNGWGFAVANVLIFELTASGIVFADNHGDAAAGAVGEFISSSVTLGSAVPLSSTVPTDITSISLTPGDWDVWGTIQNFPGAGSLLVDILGWIHTVSGTIPTAPNGGAYVLQAYAFPANAVMALPVGQKRLSLAVTTNVFLSMRTTQSAAGQSGYGFIGARRVR